MDASMIFAIIVGVVGIGLAGYVGNLLRSRGYQFSKVYGYGGMAGGLALVIGTIYAHESFGLLSKYGVLAVMILAGCLLLAGFIAIKTSEKP